MTSADPWLMWNAGPGRARTGGWYAVLIKCSRIRRPCRGRCVSSAATTTAAVCSVVVPSSEVSFVCRVPYHPAPVIQLPRTAHHHICTLICRFFSLPHVVNLRCHGCS